MSHPSFFPGNNLLLEKTVIHTTPDDASAIQLQVRSDLTTMKAFSFDTWRPIIASRYASDPLIMELLSLFEKLSFENPRRISELEREIEELRDGFCGEESEADEPQTWQSIFP